MGRASVSPSLVFSRTDADQEIEVNCNVIDVNLRWDVREEDRCFR